MLQQLKLIVLLLVAIFFLCVGILLLISTYQLANPFVFIITFFAANLMILISATLALGFALRLIKNHRNRSPKNSHSADQN